MHTEGWQERMLLPCCWAVVGRIRKNCKGATTPLLQRLQHFRFKSVQRLSEPCLLCFGWLSNQERTIIQSGDGSRKDRLKKGEEFSVDESLVSRCALSRPKLWYARNSSPDFALLRKIDFANLRYTMFKQDNQRRFTFLK